MPRKPLKRPPVIFNEDTDLTEIARYLIERAGGAQAARDAIARANRAKEKKSRGKPPRGDTHWLLIADAIQRDERCSRWKALTQAAQLAASAEDPMETIRRRLDDKLKKHKCETLEEYAKTYPLADGEIRFKVTRKVTREKDLGGTVRNQTEFVFKYEYE
jgi:hypothetical protein